MVENVDLVMDYLGKVLETISEHEKELQLSLKTFLNASGRGEDPVLRFRGEVVSIEFLASNFNELHYKNPIPDKKAVARPKQNLHVIKAILRQKVELLKKLDIPHEKPPIKIVKWLSAED